MRPVIAFVALLLVSCAIVVSSNVCHGGPPPGDAVPGEPSPAPSDPAAPPADPVAPPPAPADPVEAPPGPAGMLYVDISGKPRIGTSPEDVFNLVGKRNLIASTE